MATDDWHVVDIETELSLQAQEQYAEMKERYKYYADAKRAFQGIMQLEYVDRVPEGQELKFGYNFGRLSLALGPKRPERGKKAAANGKTLAEWLKDHQDD